MKTNIATAWEIKFKDGKHKLLIVDKNLKVPDIINMIKIRNLNKRFTIQNTTIGEFNLDRKTPVQYSFSTDGRKITQELKVEI